MRGHVLALPEQGAYPSRLATMSRQVDAGGRRPRPAIQSGSVANVGPEVSGATTAHGLTDGDQRDPFNKWLRYLLSW
jgi:hypothetical protein